MQTLTTGKKTCILRLVAFQARVTMGTSVGISNEKALGIVWGNRKNKNSSTNAAPQQLWLFVHPVHSNCTALAFLLDWCFFYYWILSLKTIPSPIAVVIRTQLPGRFGNRQLQIIPWFRIQLLRIMSLTISLNLMKAVATGNYQPNLTSWSAYYFQKMRKLSGKVCCSGYCQPVENSHISKSTLSPANWVTANFPSLSTATETGRLKLGWLPNLQQKLPSNWNSWMRWL